MPGRRISRADPKPLETDDVLVVALITGGWVVALLVLLVLRLTGEDVRDWWLVMCGYGIALGLYGIRYCRRRHAAMARDAAKRIPQRS